ncbi:MAG: hypothetical protein EXR75_15750, partial [Myxococcales bacterium]|nr:hypothetical protein [Myxococcales bacterium]
MFFVALAATTFVASRAMLVPRCTPFALVVLFAACSAAPSREPLGLLPTAETTARPSWMPYRIGAGKTALREARETRLAELRQLTFDGASGRSAWDSTGKTVYFVSGPGCATLRAINLETGLVREVVSRAGAHGAASRADGSIVVAQCEATTASASACVPRRSTPDATATALPACELVLRRHAEATTLAAAP